MSKAQKSNREVRKPKKTAAERSATEAAKASKSANPVGDAFKRKK
jgi:hypothetical protein